MSNLDDVLVEHIKMCHLLSCKYPHEGRSCEECEHFKCIDRCPRCAQERLLAWQRKNIKLTRTKERNPYLTKEFSTVKNSVASVAGSQGFDRGIQSQLSHDQQTINKILVVE